MNDLMEWWKWFYVYIRVLLAVLSYTVFLLVMFVIVYVPYWLIRKVVLWIYRLFWDD